MGRLTSPLFYQQSPPPTTGDLNAERTATMTALAEMIGGTGPETCTISDGVISPTSAFVLVDTEEQSAADDLTTINIVRSASDTLHNGMVIFLQAKDAARTVTIKNSAIRTADGNDIVLSTMNWVVFRLDSGVWWEVSLMARDAAQTASAVYVDAANGSDANDGLTADTAVATIGRALRVSQGVYSPVAAHRTSIYIAAGGYTESVEVDVNVQLILQGNVTLTGDFIVGSKAMCQFGGGFAFTLNGNLTAEMQSALVLYDVSSVTVNGVFSATDSSVVDCHCSLSVSAGSVSDVVAICDSSYFHCRQTASLQITGTDISGSLLFVCRGSLAYLECAVVLTASTVGTAAATVQEQSAMNLDSTGSVSINGSDCANGLFVNSNSSLYCFGDLEIAQDTLTTRGLVLSRTSSAMFQDTTVTLRAGSYSALVCGYGSFAMFTRCNLYTTCKSAIEGVVRAHNSGTICIINTEQQTVSISGSAASVFAIRAINNSSISLVGGRYTFSGTYSTAVVAPVVCSNVSISTECTLSGSPTGKRYNIFTCSAIDVGGAGVNRIPGTVAGTAASATFGYYG